MSALLWLGLALLLAPALWLLVVPLRHAGAERDALAAEHAAARHRHLAEYRRRRAALDGVRARGEIDAAAHAAGCLELERALLDADRAAPPGSPETPLRPARAGRRLVVALLCGVAALSLLGYIQFGAEPALARHVQLLEAAARLDEASAGGR
ncbi:c-type cytochrome biogenesis protein CcmI [Modicisalibacter radicis]|uniref:c-type cytochrome biogenesis protein CcmI n=1 Tax=Halomonas sp. EAR18 TaxID=2518972 RepID=UPI00109D50FB|nr:c-type cytochrome biogenesis protein CcmI [Halomonas sp. EAR18]